MEKINIRNLYIDLLNKIKKVEGVDKDYVDDLVEVIDLHLSALDQDLSAITNVIPEDASVSNQLVPESGLEPITLDIQTLSSTVSGIGIDVSGIQAVIPSSASSSNKLATINDIEGMAQESIVVQSSEWEARGDGTYYCGKHLVGDYDYSFIPTVFSHPDSGLSYYNIRDLVTFDIGPNKLVSLVSKSTKRLELVFQGKLT